MTAVALTQEGQLFLAQHGTQHVHVLHRSFNIQKAIR
jgi:hypothetical protein